MPRIEEVQFVHWGSLRPDPVPLLTDGINMATGPNGSGKTCFLDGLKLLLGVTDYTAGRTPAKYIFDGGSDGTPADRAYLRATFANPVAPQGRHRVFAWAGHGCEDAEHVTIVCVVTGQERFYLALPGRIRWGVGGSDLVTDLGEIDAAPRSRRMGPRQYDELLDRTGVTKALRSVLSLPQGATDRLVEESPAGMLRRLLELTGKQQTLEEFRHQREAYDQARDAYGRTLERFRSEQRHLELLDTKAKRHIEWVERREDLASHEQVLLPAAHHRDRVARRDDLAAEVDQRQKAVDEDEARLAELGRDLPQLRARHEELSAWSDDLTAKAAEARSELQTSDRRLGGLEALGKRATAERDAARDLAGKLTVEQADADAVAAGASRRDSERRHEQLNAERQRLDDEVATLRSGRPVPPDGLADFVGALRERDIEATVVADVVDLPEDADLDDGRGRAAEAALGDALWAVVVPAGRYAETVATARDLGHPWPVARATVSGDAVGSDAPTTDAPTTDGTGPPATDRTDVYAPATGRTDAPTSDAPTSDTTGADAPATGDTTDVTAEPTGALAALDRPGDLTALLGALDLPTGGSVESAVASGRSAVGDGVRYGPMLSQVTAPAQPVLGRRALERRLAAAEDQAAAVASALAEIDQRIPVLQRARRHAEDVAAAVRRVPELTRTVERLDADLDAARQDHAPIADRAAWLDVETGTVQRELGELTERLRSQQEQHEVVQRRLDETRRPQLRRSRQQLDEVEAQLEGEELSAEQLVALEEGRVPATEVVERDTERLRGEVDDHDRYPDDVRDELILAQRDSQREIVAQVDELVGGRREDLEEQQQLVEEARSRYQEHVGAVVRLLNQEFGRICSVAGADGEIRAVPSDRPDELGVEVRVAHRAGETKRSYRDPTHSGGQRAKIAILILLAAMGVGGAADLLVMDEHIAHLDSTNIDHIADLMRALRERVQFVLATPTNAEAQRLGWADIQLAFLPRGPGDVYTPPIRVMTRLEADDLEARFAEAQLTLT